MAPPVDAVIALASGLPLVVLGALFMALRRGRAGRSFFGLFAVLWGAQVVLANLGRVLEAPALHARAFPLSLALVPAASLFLAHFAARELAPRQGARVTAAWAALAAVATVVLVAAPDLVVVTMDAPGFPTAFGPAAAPLFVAPFFGAFFLALIVFYRASGSAPTDVDRHRARGFLQALALFTSYAVVRQAAVFAAPPPNVPATPALGTLFLAAFFLVGLAMVAGIALHLVLAPRAPGRRDLPLLAAFLVPAAWAAAEVGLVGASVLDSAGLWRLAAVATLVFHQQDSDLLELVGSLRASEERQRTILRSIEDGYLEADLRGRVTECNDFLAQLLDKPAAQVVGAPVAALTDPEGARAFDAAFRDTQQGHRAVKGVDARVVRADGEARAVELAVSAIRGSSGQVQGYRCFVRDVTDRRRAEDAHRRAEEQRRELARLEEVNRMKTQFINTAAHELGTPLTPIRLQLDLLRQGGAGALSPPQQRALEITARNVQRLSDLVADILEGARLQAGRFDVRKESVDLAALAAEAAASFEEPAKRAGLTLRFEPAKAALPVRGDPKRLLQVLFNLLDNALKYTPSGGRVVLEAARLGDEAVVRVHDTGIGIAAADMPRLFQPFTQVHDASTTPRGTGLGLYISRGIVTLHEGSLECLSDGPGKGCVFTVRLAFDGGMPPASPTRGRPARRLAAKRGRA